jgi:hypothetical protein
VRRIWKHLIFASLDEPIRMEDIPASAFDSAEERARVAALLEQYN